jgi:hypothetical protein
MTNLALTLLAIAWTYGLLLFVVSAVRARQDAQSACQDVDFGGPKRP